MMPLYPKIVPLYPEILRGRIDIWKAGRDFAFASPAFPAQGTLPRSGRKGPHKQQATTADPTLALPIPDYPRGVGMSTGHWRFKHSEIVRAAKAVQSAGLPVRSVEIAADGRVKINVVEPSTARERPAIDNEWDEVFNGNDSDDGTH